MSEQTEEQKAAAKAAAEAKPTKKKVRVIADYGPHEIDDVVSLSPEAAKAAVEAGWADDHPSAVKYAEGLKKPIAAGADGE